MNYFTAFCVLYLMFEAFLIGVFLEANLIDNSFWFLTVQFLFLAVVICIYIIIKI